MWHVGINRVVLALAVGLGLLIATADKSEVASVDPHYPATVLPFVIHRLRAVESYVRTFSAREVMVAAGLRERTQRPIPSAALPD